MKKTYAFIDSQNLNLSIRNDLYKNGQKIYEGWSLDFQKFHTYLKNSHRVSQAYLFIGFDPTNQTLYKYLQQIGYILIFKPILLQKGIKKGNCDAELVLHAMIELPNYDSAVIVTGDGDFYCLVEYLDKQNKLENILIPNKLSFSSFYRKHIDKIKYISILKSKLSK
jgi:uncharacterized LabA/DUF88 family protein